MRKIGQFIFIMLVFLSLVVVVLRFGSKPLGNVLGLRDRTGIKVESMPEAQVLIDSKEMGKTPFDSDQLEVGEHLIELKLLEGKASWSGNVSLNPGTVTVVNRELGESVASSSGEVISLEKGKGVIVVSTPSEADVMIDGKGYGRTPIKFDDLPAGEHVFIVGRSNYLKRSIKAALVDAYRLSITVDLALSEADLTKVNATPIEASKELVIKQTPTGFLRVRADATTNGAEIGRLNPGETVTLLEETPGWFKVRLKDGKEGYISSAYATKK